MDIVRGKRHGLNPKWDLAPIPLKKGMNPNILIRTVGKTVEQTELLSLGMATNLGEGKLWIQTS